MLKWFNHKHLSRKPLSSNASSIILLKTDVYPLPKDLALLNVWEDSLTVTVCLFRTNKKADLKLPDQPHKISYVLITSSQRTK